MLAPEGGGEEEGAQPQKAAPTLVNSSPKIPRLEGSSAPQQECYDVTLQRKDNEGFGFVILTSKNKPPPGGKTHRQYCRPKAYSSVCGRSSKPYSGNQSITLQLFLFFCQHAHHNCQEKRRENIMLCLILLIKDIYLNSYCAHATQIAPAHSAVCLSMCLSFCQSGSFKPHQCVMTSSPCRAEQTQTCLLDCFFWQGPHTLFHLLGQTEILIRFLGPL